jgi:hypothetical protein
MQAREFRFLDGRAQLTVLQNGAGGIPVDPADSQYDHFELAENDFGPQINTDEHR